jgi:hypothetical protein
VPAAVGFVRDATGGGATETDDPGSARRLRRDSQTDDDRGGYDRGDPPGLGFEHRLDPVGRKEAIELGFKRREPRP